MLLRKKAPCHGTADNKCSSDKYDIPERLFLRVLQVLFSLFQFFGTAFICYNINKSYLSDVDIVSSIFNMPVHILLYMLVFFLLGFFLYAFYMAQSVQPLSQA